MSSHIKRLEGLKSERRKPVTIQALSAKKRRGEKITSLTCYDYTTAKILDGTSIDFLLVGDSLAMTVLGHEDTLSVTVDEMLHHVRAVARGARRALVVADMPFMSYQVDQSAAVENAGRFIREGRAKAVKIEGATDLTLRIIRQLTETGIPVMGHLGFTPQSVNALGGFKVQGKDMAAARKLVKDARALQEAGVFALVLEMVPVEVASLITAELDVPTIGIGAGNVCDGQILVVDDILGRYQDLSPRFVRRYQQLARLTQEAAEAYANDTRSGEFPNNTSEAFHFPEDQLANLYLSVEPNPLPAVANAKQELLVWPEQG